MGDIHVTWDKGQLTFDNQGDSPSLTVKCELSLVPCHVYITHSTHCPAVRLTIGFA